MSVIVDVSVNLRGHTDLDLYKADAYSAARARGQRPWTVETLIPALDAAGVEKAGLIASVAAHGVGGSLDPISAEDVYTVVQGAPDRLFGWVGINPLTTMDTLRYIERAVVEYGFKGVHCYPHWFGVRVDDRTYWPIYAKCAELGIPLALQVGAPAPRNRAKLVAKPSWLDDVAFAFPELKLIGLHIGGPWVEEMIMLCKIHENVFIIADAHDPLTWPSSLVSFISGDQSRSDGASKVLWGTDWPVQEFTPSLAHVRQLGLPEDAEQKLLGTNALRVLGL